MQNFLRLLRTLWYVPPAALGWRIWARAKRGYYQSPFYNLSQVVADGPLEPIHWLNPGLLKGDKARGADLAQGRWRLAGQELLLGAPPRTWLPKAQPLQVFELHYHEWLADLRAADDSKLARALVADWLIHYAHYHPTVWHPYPLSLRVVMWLHHGQWLLAEAEPDFAVAFNAALRAQLAHLRHNCEWDLGGNHLIKNLKALLLGGVALNDGELALWAENELLTALAHQVLPDGAHDERSPHYHAQVLQDVLEIRAALRNSGGGGGVWDATAARMGAALAFYIYPDGQLGLWNDGNLGDAAHLDQLVRESGATATPTALPEAGYLRLHAGTLGLLLDAGKVGPDENPGHAHADTLAFELWHGTQRVVVNGGTLAYQHKLRGYFRSTAAHSTLEVAGENSAEVWAEHRVGRRPQQVGFKLDGPTVRAWHDGYRHLGVQHVRTLTLTAEGLAGTDEIITKQPETLAKLRGLVRWHLHPSVQVRQRDEQMAELTLPNGAKATFTCQGGSLTVKPSRYAPQFNQLLETQQLVVRLQGARLSWTLHFAP